MIFSRRRDRVPEPGPVRTTNLTPPVGESLTTILEHAIVAALTPYRETGRNRCSVCDGWRVMFFQHVGTGLCVTVESCAECNATGVKGRKHRGRNLPPPGPSSYIVTTPNILPFPKG